MSRGHLAKVCRSKLRNQSKHANVVEGAEYLSESTHMLFNLLGHMVPPIVLHVAVNGQEVPMELDTGASIITKQVWEMMQSPCPVLRPSAIKLCTYTGETIYCLGKISVSAGCNQQQHICQLVVVKGGGPCLLEEIGSNTSKYPGKMCSTPQHTILQMPA